MRPMRSDLVVISWWSNCLGLACLHSLIRHIQNRAIYVVQVGKSETGREHFRDHMPRAVTELPYSADAPAEHCQVIETVARELLPDHAGLWFLDHDVFVQEDCEPWLHAMDGMFSRSSISLCYPAAGQGPAITSPAFWLSPRRCPADVPSFAPVPYRESLVSKQPYRFRHDAELRMPEKDTLVSVQEYLLARGMARSFPVTRDDAVSIGQVPFPQHTHLSGLYVLAGVIPPRQLDNWTRRCVDTFTAFYAQCPQQWIDIEDATLLRRLREFQRALGGDSDMTRMPSSPIRHLQAREADNV